MKTPDQKPEPLSALGCIGLVRPIDIIEADQHESGPRFLGAPERWLDDPTWRCENGHVSKRYLKSERLGRSACLECEGHLWLTFPEDRERPNGGSEPRLCRQK
jgi:hypothetical protein